MSVLYKFNAGRVSFDEVSKLCTPHPMKGEISIKQSEEEGFFDFIWTPKDKSAGVESESFLVIPGDVAWKQVKSCKTGRVFTLTFLSSGAKNLYWLQDVGDDDDLSKLTQKDIEITEQINRLLGEEIDEDEEEESAEAETTIKTESSSVGSSQPLYEISDVISPDLISKYISSLSEDQLTKFYEYLPSSIPHNKNELLSVLRSGFFKSSSNKLSNALKNGAGGIVSRSLNYQYVGEGIESFLNAVRDKGIQEKKDK